MLTSFSSMVPAAASCPESVIIEVLEHLVTYLEVAFTGSSEENRLHDLELVYFERPSGANNGEV